MEFFKSQELNHSLLCFKCVLVCSFLQRCQSEALERKKTDDDADSDADSVGSDEFEEMLEGIMKKKGFKKDIDEDEDEDEPDVDFANEYTTNMAAKNTKRKKTDGE